MVKNTEFICDRHDTLGWLFVKVPGRNVGRTSAINFVAADPTTKISHCGIGYIVRRTSSTGKFATTLFVHAAHSASNRE